MNFLTAKSKASSVPSSGPTMDQSITIDDLQYRQSRYAEDFGYDYDDEDEVEE